MPQGAQKKSVRNANFQLPPVCNADNVASQQRHTMNSFIASQIRDIATSAILDALENGDAIKTAKELRAEIKAGWLAALEESGMSEELIKSFKLPL
jgi:Mg/Co/Ni transporter MgtE